jgi:hypothetical protein
MTIATPNDAGKYYQRFQHCPLTLTYDEFGSSVEAHIPGDTYWGVLLPLRPSEALAIGQNTNQLFVKIIIKNNPPIEATSRLVDVRTGDVYELNGPPMWNKIELTMIAHKGTAA